MLGAYEEALSLIVIARGRGKQGGVAIANMQQGRTGETRHAWLVMTTAMLYSSASLMRRESCCARCCCRSASSPRPL